MGWTSYHAIHYNNRGQIDRKAECDSYWEDGLNEGHFKVVKSAMRGKVYYGAIKSLVRYVGKTEDNKPIYEPIPENEQTVFAVVFLTSVDMSDYYNFAYKDMDESALPYYFDCPKSILDTLSPTDDKDANEWRKRCYERIKQSNEGKSISKLPIGSIIRFQYGEEMRELIKRPASYQFKTPWWQVVGYNKYMPKNRIPKDFEIVRIGMEG